MVFLLRSLGRSLPHLFSCKKKRNKCCFSMVSCGDSWPTNVRNRSGSPFVALWTVLLPESLRARRALGGCVQAHWAAGEQLPGFVEPGTYWLMCISIFRISIFMRLRTFACLHLSAFVLKMRLRDSWKFWEISYRSRLRDSQGDECSPGKRGRHRRRRQAGQKETKGTNMAINRVTG